MALKDCLADLRKIAGEKLTDDELLQILDTVESRRRAKQAMRRLESADSQAIDAARSLGEEAKVAALIEKRSRMINILRKQARFSRYDAMPGREAEGLSAVNAGAEGPRAGAAASVDAERQALQAALFGPLIGELRQAGLLTVIRGRNEAFDRDVARELWRLSDATAAETGNAHAAKAAEILGKYQEMARLLQNEAGAFIRKLPGWIVRQSHNGYRIAHASADSALARLRRGGTERDYAAWRDFIGPKLDERTFAEAGIDAGDGAARDKFLRQVWVNLVSGNHERAHGAADWLGGFTGPGNLAKRVSQERVLHFKSADDWFDYNKRFGTAGLFEAVMGGLRNAARNTALMRVWGTNPDAAFDADVRQLARRARDRGDFRQHDRLQGWRLKAEFDALTGAANIPGNPTLGAAGEAVRNLQAMAKLGGVVLSSLPDIAIHASTLRHHGVGYLEGVGDGLRSLLRGRGADAEREIADYIGVGIDGVLGHMLAQFNATDGVPGRMSKLMDLFFRANLLNWWTDSMKTGAGLMLARHLARNAGNAWDALPETLRIALGRHGIEVAEWEAIRAAGLREAAGIEYLTGEGIGDLPDEAIAELAQDEILFAGETGRDPVMPKEPAPQEFALEGLPRRAWRADFPDVVVHRHIFSPVRVTQHPDYKLAKSPPAGQERAARAAALRLLRDVLDDKAIEWTRLAIGKRNPIVVAVHGLERGGRNQIPLAFAATLGERLGLAVDDGIVQTNRTFHTGAGWAHRVVTRATFTGAVRKGADYLIVDDAISMGSTLADIRTYIEANGGRVILASTLMSQRPRERLGAGDDLLRQLRQRFPGLEDWWRERFGNGFEGLTDAEARRLLHRRSGTADAIRNRIAAARQAAGAARAEGDAAAREGGGEASQVTPERLARILTKARADLALKLRAYFIDSVNESMTIGGVREAALRTFGTQAGTPVGEAVRFVMQFKSFPITFFTRHIRREISRRGHLDGAGLAFLIAGSTAMGYLAMSAKDLAKGRSPRDPRDIKTWFAAMQQGGGLGIYGDFLFGQYNRFGGGGIETLLGPTAGAVGEALRIYGGATGGEDVGAKSLRFVVNNTPFVNLFYTRLALDYLVLWHIQELMNPGWARRFEQRVGRENNQTFILRPSTVVN